MKLTKEQLEKFDKLTTAIRQACSELTFGILTIGDATARITAITDKIDELTTHQY